MANSPTNSKPLQRQESSSPGTLAIIVILFRSVTVEPCMFLLCGGFEIFRTVVTTGLYWKVCEQQFGDDPQVDCRRPDLLEKHQEKLIQQNTALWNMYSAVSQIAPLIIIAPIYGTFGDKYGRKINLLIGLLGMVLFGLLQTAQFSIVQMPLIVTPFAGLIISLTGFIGSLFASCYAYVADETRDHNILTYRLSFLQVCGNVADIIFGFVTGALLKHMSYAYTMMIAIVLWTLAFFYVLVYMKQIPPRYNKAQMSATELRKFTESQNTGPSVVALSAEPGELTIDSPRPLVHADSNTSSTSNGHCKGMCELIVASVKAMTRHRVGNLRACIWITVASFFALNCSNMGMGFVLNLFCLGEPLHWTPSAVAYYNGFNSIIQLVGTLVGTFVMKHYLKFHETSILLATIVSTILKCLMVGLATNSIMMYASSVLGIVSNLTFAITKSLAVQFVDRDEVGKVYSLFQIATDSSVILAFAGFSSLYFMTVTIFPGLVFLFTAVLGLVALAPFVWVHIDFKRYRNSRKMSDDIAKIDQKL